MARDNRTRDFDLIVWGATGFTGRLVVEYLLRNYPQGEQIKWAVAGRNMTRLESVVADLSKDGPTPAVLVADINDQKSLVRLAQRARVVLTTVGPYAKYGSELVAACVQCDTDYCDLSGEPQWMRRMIDQHQRDAVSSGARIVHSCGFDSIPSDFGVWFLQQHAREHFGSRCRRISMLVRAAKGGASGGTFASSFQAMSEARQDRAVARILVDPYALNPDGERSGPDQRDQTGIEFNNDAQTWTAPLVMAAVNTKIVRRTNALLGYPYGCDFRYSEAIMTGPGGAGWCKAAGITASLGAFMLGSANKLLRTRVVEKLVPKPGEGPSREQRENGFFNLLMIGELEDGSRLRARIRGDRDPGYGSTCKMLSESAVCLASDTLSVGGGFWTPVAAMGESLMRRLTDNAGLSFEITS